MKKIASAAFGLSLALATVGVSLAAQNTAPATGTTSTSATKPAAKKHVKRNKKAATSNSTSATHAPAASK